MHSKAQPPDREALLATLHRVRVPPVPRRAGPTLRGGEDGRSRPALGGRVPAGRYAGAVRRVPRGLRRQPQVLRRHRDDRARSAPGEPGRAVVLAGRRARPITCRCAGRSVLACSTSEATLEALRPILADPAIEKVGQNVKYDMLVLARAGHRAGRADDRHDDPELPARERRAEPQPRPALPAAARPRR